MELPQTLRDDLVEELDQFLDAFAGEPDVEAVVAYVVELLELWADDQGQEDLVTTLEEESSLDGSLQDVLESELGADIDQRYTGEEVVSLLERTCAVEWTHQLEDEETDELEDLDDLDELSEEI